MNHTKWHEIRAIHWGTLVALICLPGIFRTGRKLNGAF